MRCITCARESDTARCVDCTKSAQEAARARRIGEGAQVMARVGVPEQLLEARLQPSDWTEVGDGKGVALYGPPGRGKSWQAAGLVRRRLWGLARSVPDHVEEWWTGVRFSRADALLQWVRAEAFGSDRSEAAVVEELGRTEWLVLDDFGAEKRSEWVGQTWHSLLSHREATRTTTILTTNYTSDDLEHMYAGWGPPIVSRLHAACEWVPVDGPDLRRKKK